MAMGFTVPVLSLETALPGGAMQEAARLGPGPSASLAGPLALVLRSGAKSPTQSRDPLHGTAEARTLGRSARCPRPF